MPLNWETLGRGEEMAMREREIWEGGGAKRERGGEGGEGSVSVCFTVHKIF